MLKKYLGKKVKVKIDRAMGKPHPEFGWKYPVNYGFIPETKAGDGEEIDAYILGVKKPLEEFEGRVVAVVHRLNDNEEKLVVAPKDFKLTKKEIKNKIHFQEKWFKSKIKMHE